MAKTKISDLREHLFATLEALQDEDRPMELDRAKTIAEVGKVIIESAKVEVEAYRVIAASGGQVNKVPDIFEKHRPLLSTGVA